MQIYTTLCSCVLCLIAFAGFGKSLFSYEVAIVSMFRNTGPYIREWVDYHYMIGVDHFWLYNDDSDDNWEEALKAYIADGIVEVFYWPSGKPDWVPGQLAAFQDGIRKAIGVAKWVALLDQDEFILPMQDKSLPECLRNHYSHAAGIYANWRNFGTSGVCLSDGQYMLPLLTRCSQKHHSRNAVGKSIFRPECASIDQLWSPHFCPLKPGFRYSNGNGTETLEVDGSDLKTDGKKYELYIRINHYAFRDENYFYNIRLPRDSNRELMLEHHKAFNVVQDNKILDFIKKYYPEKYEMNWKERAKRTRTKE
jgi:hypothetical protein